LQRRSLSIACGVVGQVWVATTKTQEEPQEGGKRKEPQEGGKRMEPRSERQEAAAEHLGTPGKKAGVGDEINTSLVIILRVAAEKLFITHAKNVGCFYQLLVLHGGRSTAAGCCRDNDRVVRHSVRRNVDNMWQQVRHGVMLLNACEDMQRLRHITLNGARSQLVVL